MVARAEPSPAPASRGSAAESTPAAPAALSAAGSAGAGDGASVGRSPTSAGGGDARTARDARTASDAAAASAGPPGGQAGATLALAVPGAGGDGAEYMGYLALVRRRIQESLAYPTIARRRGLTGTVHIELAIEATGVISEVLLASSSSHRALDDAALEAVRGLERVPFPSGLRPRRLRVRLPVVFDLR